MIKWHKQTDTVEVGSSNLPVPTILNKMKYILNRSEMSGLLFWFFALTHESGFQKTFR